MSSDDHEDLGPGGKGQLAILAGEIRALKREASRLAAGADALATAQQAIAAQLERQQGAIVETYRLLADLHHVCMMGFGFASPDELHVTDEVGDSRESSPSDLEAEASAAEPRPDVTVEEPREA